MQLFNPNTIIPEARPGVMWWEETKEPQTEASLDLAVTLTDLDKRTSIFFILRNATVVLRIGSYN